MIRTVRTDDPDEGPMTNRRRPDRSHPTPNTMTANTDPPNHTQSSSHSTDQAQPSTGVGDEPGPRLLTERPLAGIFVHSLAMVPFGIGLVIAAVVYHVSDHPFTGENARNALNWHLTVLAFTVAFLAVFTVVATMPEIPYLTAGLFFVVLVPLFVVLFVVNLCYLLFWIVATVKAIFGTAWRYPFAHEFI